MRFFTLLTCAGLFLASGACADRGITDPDSVQEEPFQVEGVVASAVDGAPLSRVLVRVFSLECPNCTLTTGKVVEVIHATAYSDDSGHYALRGEAQCGLVFIEAKHHYYRPGKGLLVCGSRRQELNFALSPLPQPETVTLQFTGEVRFNGQLVEDANVYFTKCSGAESITRSCLATTKTDADGRYTLTYALACFVGEYLGSAIRLRATGPAIAH